MRALVRAAILQGRQDQKSPQAVLEAVLLGQFTSSVTNGSTVVETSEAGGSVRFVLPGGLSPSEVITLMERAISWIELQTDPTNPALPRLTKRLFADFRQIQV